jgi:MoaA/NifB/PqqE/SkfB family radical SAM enzyme
VNDLCDLAHELGFFSCTITTNAQLPFPDSHADSIWVSLDGLGKYHDAVRGEGTFARLEKNVASCGHKALSVSMSVNTLNVDSIEEVLDYVKASPFIKSIAFNFHTPFEGTEYLTLPPDVREKAIDTIIAYKKKGYPIMNSRSGLKRMKHLDFKKRCWISNYVFTDGTKLPSCPGYLTGACEQCGFSMAGEMDAVFHFCPDTILAGMDLRLPEKK